MNRRKFILGFGAAAASGTAALGTGAFTSVQASRGVTIEVADDSKTVLSLNPTTEFATTQDSGKFRLDLSPSNPTDAGGEGVNLEAVTRIQNAFEIINRGTQQIELFFDGDFTRFQRKSISLDDGALSVEIFSNPADPEPGPGDIVPYIIEIDARGADPEETINETVNIIAEAVED